MNPNPVFSLRDATLGDAAAIARVHVASWRETYAGIVPQQHLDRMSVEKRTERWRASLGAPAPGEHTLVAELPDAGGVAEIVGFSAGGPNRTEGTPYQGELRAIYCSAPAVMQISL